LKSVAELLAIILFDAPNVIASKGLVVPIPILPLSKILLLVIVEEELNFTT
jgi:hypothetical protein